MILKRGQKLRIRSHREGGRRPVGRDVCIMMLDEDGGETPVPNVAAVTYQVDARDDYARIGLVIHGDADVDGELDSIAVIRCHSPSVTAAIVELEGAAIEYAAVVAGHGAEHRYLEAKDRLEAARASLNAAIVAFSSIGGPPSLNSST